MWEELQAFFESSVLPESCTGCFHIFDLPCVTCHHEVWLARHQSHVPLQLIGRVLPPERLEWVLQQNQGRAAVSSEKHSAQSLCTDGTTMPSWVIREKNSREERTHWKIFFGARLERIVNRRAGHLVLLWWTAEELCKTTNLVQTMQSDVSQWRRSDAE